LEIADEALDEMASWLDDGGQVGIYDAANHTEERRKTILDKLEAREVKVAFIEIICDKSDLVDANIREHKVTGPDYQQMDEQEAFTLFKVL
jgi:hypothetical protein